MKKPFSHRTTSSLVTLFGRYPGVLAAALVLSMAILAYGSMVGNSAIIDEVAHIPAGYSYIAYGDYRLNPEHPPLIKDLAALPLQFMQLKFPVTLPAWTNDVNGQWETGWNFLYHIGNNADAILFWSRLPILLLALGFGVALYCIVKRRWGSPTALLALFFYALSPNILAHATLVTTDLGASVTTFLAVIAFGSYIERPNRTTFSLLSLALAVAQLTKFSALLLYPFMLLCSIGLGWVLQGSADSASHRRRYVYGVLGASAVSLALVWLYYGSQVYAMPQGVQDRLIAGSLTTAALHPLAHALTSLAHVPLMKPLVQYLLGVSMVFGRVVGGNVTYFNGAVQSGSYRGYFPELFAVKTQLALLLIAAIVGTAAVVRRRQQPLLQRLGQLRVHMAEHLFEWLLALFAIFYFSVSVAGNLDLGIRHILPVYIPIFVVCAVATVRFISRLEAQWFKASIGVLAALLIWYAGSTISAYPKFISYFNEVIAGHSEQYFSDSSVDWGQDLKRLKIYTDNHPQIHKLAIDYFGGGLPAYYYCPRLYGAHGQLVTTSDGYDCSRSVYLEWHAQYGTYTGQYIAVSETFLENDRYYASLYHQPGYGYLRSRQPYAKIGNSIFIYKLY